MHRVLVRALEIVEDRRLGLFGQRVQHLANPSLTLAADQDVQAYTERPLTDDENALAEIADWGPAEDWADWADAAR